MAHSCERLISAQAKCGVKRLQQSITLGIVYPTTHDYGA